MQHCDKCKVDVAGSRETCPLCQGALSGVGDETEERFPLLPPVSHRYHFLLRVVIFVSVAVAVVCVSINFLMPAGGSWSLFVLAGIGCMWLSLIIGIQKKNNVSKNIIWQVVTLSTLAILWDRFTGWRAWSIDFVIPAICIVAMVAIAVTAKIKGFRLSDFLIYLILDAIFGILPVVFLLCGWTHVALPSVISVASSVLALAALLLFAGDNLQAEVRRRLHL